MLTIYGTKQCRFCVECKSAFDEQGSGKLGIPLIKTEEGIYTRDWKQFLPENDKN